MTLGRSPWLSVFWWGMRSTSLTASMQFTPRRLCACDDLPRRPNLQGSDGGKSCWGDKECFTCRAVVSPEHTCQPGGTCWPCAEKCTSAQHIAHVHAAIRSALDAFASEAASLAGSDSLKPSALAALVERLRFLRAVCSYHSASEDDVLFPAVR